MINYGKFEIIMDDFVNEAFVQFSYNQEPNISVEELFCMLICYGLVELGYLNLDDVPYERD